MTKQQTTMLRVRLRALVAARRLGNKNDERAHLMSIRRIMGPRAPKDFAW